MPSNKWESPRPPRKEERAALMALRFIQARSIWLFFTLQWILNKRPISLVMLYWICCEGESFSRVCVRVCSPLPGISNGPAFGAATNFNKFLVFIFPSTNVAAKERSGPTLPLLLLILHCVCKRSVSRGFFHAAARSQINYPSIKCRDVGRVVRDLNPPRPHTPTPHPKRCVVAKIPALQRSTRVRQSCHSWKPLYVWTLNFYLNLKCLYNFLYMFRDELRFPPSRTYVKKSKIKIFSVLSDICSSYYANH